HVVLSLVAIVAGIVVLVGMLGGRQLNGWAGLFFAPPVATRGTGFLSGSTLDPAGVPGIFSMLALLAAIGAPYAFRLGGAWRWIYVVTALLALYLNCFVAVVQAFQKLPFLQPLAPTQSEPPFLIAQLAVLALFIVLGVLAVRRFHPAALARA